MATLEDIRGLGYEVGLSFEGDGFAVHRVEGFGVSTQVRDDDTATIDALIEGHEETAKQYEETNAETMLRWDEEGKTDLTEEERAALEEQVASEQAANE